MGSTVATAEPWYTSTTDASARGVSRATGARRAQVSHSCTAPAKNHSCATGVMYEPPDSSSELCNRSSIIRCLNHGMLKQSHMTRTRSRSMYWPFTNFWSPESRWRNLLYLARRSPLTVPPCTCSQMATSREAARKMRARTWMGSASYHVRSTYIIQVQVQVQVQSLESIHVPEVL